MKQLTTNQIRQYWIDYFGQRGHAAVDSSNLVPANDPTLMFANSGMVQFKDLFLGLEKREYSRAATSQKCLRVSGKHNDLEEVGPSPRHHTFFEMLGNFSFGDYFKQDAIEYAWNLLVNEWGLPVERLWFTVYEDDDEAMKLWIETGAAPDRVLRFGKKDNWWSMGDVGPCGPCSEIHYYWGDLADQVADGVNKDDEYLEIWNLVFMQYEQKASGEMIDLPRPSVDTGAGLERLASIMQGKDNNYDTDGFTDIMDAIQEAAGHTDAERQTYLIPYRRIADHTRSITFLIGDGVLPGNEGRSYVTRMLLRRAARFGKRIGFDRPFLGEVAQAVIAAGMVLSRAVVRDMVADERAASMIGYVTMGMSLVPMIGPVVGGFLDEAFGWQANFALLLVLGIGVLALVWADLGETATLKKASILDQMRQYPALLTSRRYWGYAASAAFGSGCFFAYLGGAPYVGTEVFGLKSSEIGMLFALTALGYAGGNFFAGRFSVRMGMNRMVLLGTIVTTAGLSMLLVLTLLGLSGPVMFFGLTIFLGLGLSLIHI